MVFLCPKILLGFFWFKIQIKFRVIIKMNKKSLIKISTVGVIFLISLALFFLLLMPIISNAFQLKEKYNLGENVIINLEDYNNYSLKIITPSNTFLKSGNEKSILFKPENFR